MRSRAATVWVLVGLSLATTGSAIASPIAIGGPFPFQGAYLFVDNVGANDLGFTPGNLIGIGALPVTPNGTGGTTATAQTTDLSTGLLTPPIRIPCSCTTASPNEFRANIPYYVNQTGPWTITFANGPDRATATTLGIGGVPMAPFATDVSVSGTALNPTFAWNYPSNVDGVTVLIYDKSRKTPSGQPDLVYSHSLAGSSNSFQLPSTLAGGLTLTAGTPYVVALKGLELRVPGGPLTNPNTASQSVAYFDFTPVTSGVPVNLPVVGPLGGYTYSMTVTGGKEYFIDPSIAVGYAYKIGADDPNFASVQLPTIQSSDFDLSYLYGGSWVTTMLMPGDIFDFPVGGVTAFDVTGIDPMLGLDPGDVTAFVTGLTFVADGTFTGTQTPLLANVPEPGTIFLLLPGFAMLIWCSGRSRRPAPPRRVCRI